MGDVDYAGNYWNGYGIFIYSGGGYKIYHNTISLAANQSNNGYPACFYIHSNVSTVGGIDVRNNIFNISATIGDQRYAVLSNANSNVFSAIDYNDYYTSATNLGYIGGSNRQVLSNWQTGTGQDINSKNVSPAFISSTNLNITPSTDGLIDGTPLASVAKDHDDETRSLTKPDMGADEYSHALPVELINFKGICQDTFVLLEWTTASETNSSYFLIETSLNLLNWSKLGTITAKGNSNNLSSYVFNTNNLNERIVYYRLTEFDNDGSSTIYDPIFTKCSIDLNTNPVLIFPNPLHDLLKIVINRQLKVLNLQIYDEQGRLIINEKYKESELASGLLEYSISSWARGLYYVKISAENLTQFEKIIVY
ncbi:MAG: T9SS type A sorting domain-containing protein [Bacteroidota bacterium]